MADLKSYIDAKAASAGNSQSGFSAINIGAQGHSVDRQTVRIPVSSAFMTMFFGGSNTTNYDLYYRKIQTTVNTITTDLPTR